MKNFLKYSLFSLMTVFIVIYAIILIAPCFISLDKFKPDIQKLVKENAKLNLDYSNLRIYSTPMLSVGVIVENLKVTFDDGSVLAQIPKTKAGIALPSLFTLTIKTAKTSIQSPQINLDIVDNEQYKIVRIVEKIINENNSKPKVEPAPIDPKVAWILDKIRIKITPVCVSDYNVNINDLKTTHKLKLSGQKLYAGYNSARNVAMIKTDAKLFSDDSENIVANINVSTSIPTVQAQKEEQDPDETIRIPFVNPVEIYQTYDLKANIDSNLKIRETKRGIISKGYVNVDNINLKLSEIRLPNSYIHLKLMGKKIQYDTNIVAKENEKIALNGMLKYGKRPRMLMNILSDEIHFDNLLALAKGFLDSLRIKNNLDDIKANGYLVANAQIKTNFKKLKSNGSILIKDGAFAHNKTGIGIKDIIVNLIFDNNALNIKDSKALINGSKLTFEGFIDSKSNADIKIDVDNLFLPPLYNTFAPKDLKNAINLNSANLTLHTRINGKLENLNANLKTKLSNLLLTDSSKFMNISDDFADIEINVNSEKILGKIENNGFKVAIPSMKTNAQVKKLTLDLNNENIIINPFDINYNSSSKINVNGQIENYLKNPIIKIVSNGNIYTTDLKQTLGKEVSYYLASKGAIPLKMNFDGNIKKQDLILQLYCDKDNYITPVNFKSLQNSPSIIQANVDIHGLKIKVKESGLFKKANSGFSDDLTLNMQDAKQIVDFATIIDGNHINLLRVNIPNEQNLGIAVFKDSSLKTKGKIVLHGFFDKIFFNGGLNVYDINIPEILTKVQSVDLNFFNQNLDLTLNKLDLNGSTMNASLDADLAFAKVFEISDVDFNSDSINVDKALVVLDKLMKYVPASSSTNSNKTAQNPDIPLAMDGKFDIKKLTTGAMVIENIKGNLGIKNNDLIISRLNCDAFKGKVKGDVKMNLLSGLLTIKLNGKKLDADKTLADAANMKNTISGDLDFKTDITLKGATYEEQVKSLKGDVDFELTDGQYGPFAKLENFFLAENIRENPLFKNTIGLILNPITTIDSTHYEKLNGKVSFNNGVVNLGSIRSQGDILCVLVNGDMNLLTNELDSKVRVRLASAVSDMLGPIAMANPVNLVKNTPGLNVATSKLFSVFSEVVTPDEYQEIPDFAKNHSDDYATKFQIVLDGNVAKPLSLVKSFKWLVLQEDMDKAREFSANFEKEELLKQLQAQYEDEHKIKVGIEKILQMDTTAPEVKKILEQEALKHKEQAIQTVQQKVETKKENTKKEIQEKVQSVENKVQEKQTETAQKIQEAIEIKKQEQEQKILDAQNQLKSKLQEKIKIPSLQTQN